MLCPDRTRLDVVAVLGHHHDSALPTPSITMCTQAISTPFLTTAAPIPHRTITMEAPHSSVQSSRAQLQPAINQIQAKPCSLLIPKPQTSPFIHNRNHPKPNLHRTSIMAALTTHRPCNHIEPMLNCSAQSDLGVTITHLRCPFSAAHH
ncbi:hypothetical protein M0R45_030418 [Rubus argutus]|uniref:Uncharacterized protein n=1 Tax=Rubus argutus TaxID=59490 RepID=A0AAW1WDM6_RUBAR